MQAELTIDNKTFRDAEREQTSILAPLERAVLQWFVRHMPARVNSDHLSILGLAGMFGAGAFYVASKHYPLMLHLVNVCIFLNWFGDSLDGTLARYRNRLRPRYGFYVDHIIDMFGAVFLIGGLALSGYMSERVAAVVLIAFFMLAINSYLTAYSLGVFKLSQWKMGPTEMRLLLMIGNVFLIYHPRAYHRRYLLFDLGGMVAVIGMLIIVVVLSVQHTYVLYRLERLPKD